MSYSLDYCPKARKEEILAHDVGNEVVIYDLKDDKAFCLNRVAAKVWKHCDGKTPVSELVGLLGELGLPAEPVGVHCVLDQLNDSRLLDNDEATESIEKIEPKEAAKAAKEAKKVTRREVLVKLGVAAAVVLTSVAAMNAPLASQAQSGGPTG